MPRCNFPTKKTGIPCKKYCVRGMNRCQSHLYQKEEERINIPQDKITPYGTPRPKRNINIEIREEEYTFLSNGEKVNLTCSKELFQKILQVLAKEKEDLLPSLLSSLGLK